MRRFVILNVSIKIVVYLWWQLYLIAIRSAEYHSVSRIIIFYSISSSEFFFRTNGHTTL